MLIYAFLLGFFCKEKKENVAQCKYSIKHKRQLFEIYNLSKKIENIDLWNILPEQENREHSSMEYILPEQENGEHSSMEYIT